MTCNHVLKEEDIKVGKSINFTLNNDKKNFTIIIDNSRLVYTNTKLDVTIIQLRNNEFSDINSFLSIDEEIFKGKSKKEFIENSIYLLHYPKGLKSNFSFGTIKVITEDNDLIYHNCGSESGSSGGPLINLINMRLIGIHTGDKQNKNLNVGIFILPIINDFFKNIDLKKIKLDDNFGDKHELKYENKDKEKLFHNEVIKSKKFDNNIQKNVDTKVKNNKLIYYLILLLSIIKQYYINYIIYFLFEFNGKKIYTMGEIGILIFIIFILDSILGIILTIMEKFLNHKMILMLSLFIPICSFKMTLSSFFHIIPFFDEKMIKEIYIGEIIANIIFIFFGFENLRLLIFIIMIIIDIFCLLLILKNYWKLDKLKEEELNVIIRLDYFNKNAFLNSLLFINYSITFSSVPYYFVLPFGKKFLTIFVLSDIFGRFLGEKFDENFYKPVIFFRFLFFMHSEFTLEKEENIIICSIYIIILGLFSGFLTSVGYYIPIKKKDKAEKISLLHYLKAGKYYSISQIGDLNEKKYN